MKSRMQAAKTLLNLVLFIAIQVTVAAQKQNVDRVSFSIPDGWQQNQQPGGTQLSISDGKTGTYAIAIITRTVSSTATAMDNFRNDWTKLVTGSVQTSGEAAMQQPTTEKGWQIISGTANYTDGSTRGVATLLTATGSGETASVVIMTNTQQYQDAILSFLNSLELSEHVENSDQSSGNIAVTPQTKAAVPGLWVSYKTESNGMYNGFPVVTGGYFRREYQLNNDGTYRYRAKDWSTLQKEILYITETGTWKIEGNQLTITPKQGKGQWWSKAASNRTSEWGKLVRAADYKLETQTYTFEIRYFSGSHDTVLILQNPKATERDGSSNSEGQVNEWMYSLRDSDKSLIDTPPGTK